MNSIFVTKVHALSVSVNKIGEGRSLVGRPISYETSYLLGKDGIYFCGSEGTRFAAKETVFFLGSNNSYLCGSEGTRFSSVKNKK